MPDIVAGGADVAEIGSGLYNSYKNQQYQDMLRKLAENPSQMEAYVRQFVQPLTAGTEAGVNNASQAYAAERGLGTSPAQQQQIQNQTIAPIIQNQQQTAFQQALASLGLGGGASPTSGAGAGTGIQALLALLKKGGATPGAQVNNPVPAGDEGANDAGGLTPPGLGPVDLTNFGFDQGAFA
jgi:hypothetical protein